MTKQRIDHEYNRLADCFKSIIVKVSFKDLISTYQTSNVLPFINPLKAVRIVCLN